MKFLSLKKHSILTISIVCFFFAVVINYLNKTTTKELAQMAEVKLHQKEKTAIQELHQISVLLKTTQPKKLFTSYQNHLAELYKKEAIGIYVYQNDSLCFWTDNQPAIDLYAYNINAKSQLIKIRNGWYECLSKKDSMLTNVSVFALISIKPEYDFENMYISNRFSAWLDLPEKTDLKTDFNYLNPIIKSSYGNSLFEIARHDGVFKNKQWTFVSSVLMTLFFCAFFIWLYAFFKEISTNRLVWLLLFFVTVLCIRTGMIYFKWPAVFYETDFYNSKVFANASSFYFSSLGDILINSVLFFLCVVLFYKSDVTKLYASQSKSAVFIISVFILLCVFSLFIHSTIFSLVKNSTISFNINDLFNFSSFSLIGLMSIAFLMFAFYLMLHKLIKFINEGSKYKKYFVFAFIIVTLVVAFYLSYHLINLFDYLWPVPLFITAFLLQKYKASFNFINVGLVVLVAAYTSSSLFVSYEKINKQQTYDVLSYSLTDRQDAIAESEFLKVSNSIKADQKLKNLLSLLPLSSGQLEQSIRQTNFTGYFERYDVVLSLFKEDCTPIFPQTNKEYLNEDYFKDEIEKYGSQTISDELFFVDKNKKNIRYVANINIDGGINSTVNYRLYIIMEPKLASSLGHFPDLLIDKSLENQLESFNISYAVYQDKRLSNSFGEYLYPIFIDNTAFDNTTEGDYNHYVYKPKPQVTLIISEKQFGLWQKFTSVSYVFILFSLIVLCCVVVNSTYKQKHIVFNSLNNRIQFILVSIVVLSLAGVVIGTIWVVTTQFESKNKRELTFKARSVLKELQLTVGKEKALTQTYKESTSYTLKKLAQLFDSDISLFNSQGYLYATSQPAIYEQGLQSKFMNPLAYSSFITEKRAVFSHRESIGNLNYLSAYIPFYNSSDKLIGYINLPYFSRQKDLEKELTAYLTTLINIYTILFALATLLALLISNLLTKPLRIIKQQIANIKFGKFNDALQWKRKDEIGELVQEYNTMLLKLEESSQLLAQTERESAWREMAKQVAHEIKNPLTPMKLNIQHLQRVVATNPNDLQERVDKVSLLLIEQIDTLANIATAFSNFAKLPSVTHTRINLYEVLQTVYDLFKQNSSCELFFEAEENLFINADKELCIRLFTNLVKNAEQAIPENRKGIINIKAREIDATSIIVEIIDNGTGIPEEAKAKLFTSYFTTKTNGTGLGLAMVKSAVTSFNGAITFETKEGVGSSFMVWFPKVD